MALLWAIEDAVNLKDLFSQMGTTIYTGMDPAEFVKSVVSVPYLVMLFPNLSTVATTVSDLITGYENLKQKIVDTEDQITDLEDKIDKAQSTINTANDAYSKALNIPGAYTAPTTGGPCTPNPANTVLQEAISDAVTALDKLKDQLSEVKKSLEALKEQLEKYYQMLMAQVSKYIDTIINTRIA